VARRCYSHLGSPRLSGKLPLARLSILLAAGVAVSSGLALLSSRTIHLDAPAPESISVGSERLVVDPATSIAFPAELHIPSRTPLPTFTLIGVGVRTVSFLGIQVYSAGFYADLSRSHLKIPVDASSEEKIEYIVRNAACVMRIIPTRATSYGHLRDGFMRALQARLLVCRNNGTLTPEEEAAVQSPMRKFKSIFPNTPLAKHTPMDVLLTPPDPSQPRSLIIRDLGSVQSNWVAQEFFLAYFAGQGLSPPLKKSVVDALESSKFP